MRKTFLLAETVPGPVVELHPHQVALGWVEQVKQWEEVVKVFCQEVSCGDARHGVKHVLEVQLEDGASVRVVAGLGGSDGVQDGMCNEVHTSGDPDCELVGEEKAGKVLAEVSGNVPGQCSPEGRADANGSLLVWAVGVILVE